MNPRDSSSGHTNRLTMDDLIRLELQGTMSALARYDSILWKIRSGYIMILYGALTILGGKELTFNVPLGNSLLPLIILMLVWGFSVCAFLADFTFQQSKLRVVTKCNRLYDLAVDMSGGTKSKGDMEVELRALLHLAGESRNKVDSKLLKSTLIWIIPLYSVTPLLVSILLFFVRL